MHSVRDKQLPSASVVVWIYGGAFLYGSKSQAMHDGFHTPLYDGRGVLSHAQHDTVFVTGNYRIGAFGWLAGTTMEEGGLPNAGLSDQRLLFDWVQRYIAQVGGDKTSVSAWGESAGASSILHHLVSRDGNGQQLQPQFTRAALQSPAYQWMWDRDGQLEETYYNFTCYVCALVEGQTCCRDPKMPQTETFSYKPKYNVSQLSQLGDKNVDWLIKANQLLFQNTVSCTGIFPVGPSVDGKFIERLAITELAKGRLPFLSLFSVYSYSFPRGILIFLRKQTTVRALLTIIVSPQDDSHRWTRYLSRMLRTRQNPSSTRLMHTMIPSTDTYSAKSFLETN